VIQVKPSSARFCEKISSTFDPRRFLNAGVKEGDTSKYTAFEAPDPTYWIPSGYAVVVIDVRGTWFSEGTAHFLAPEEAQDFYDAIEWAGTQPWSNGKVGLSGVSYLAQLQWRVAELNPPHLAAINPWEGFTDWYREFAYHGGIPETSFLPRGSANLQWSTTRTEDTPANAAAHPSMICFEIGMRDSPVAVKREFGFSPAHPAMLLALKSHFWGRV